MPPKKAKGLFMNYREKIQSAVTALAEVGELLAELGFRLAEFTRSGAGDVVLQLNGKEQKKGIDEIFTKKEILEMPKLKDLKYRYRPDRVHEFRYRRNGIYKCFCSTDFKTAKAKAMEFCRELNQNENVFGNRKYVAFSAFAEYYLKNVKKINLAKKSYDNLYNRYQVHILPAFKDKYLFEIKAPILQAFLNGIIDRGLKRTAEGCYYILKNILQYACDNDIIAKNPMNVVKIPLHRRTTGSALTLEKERKFVKDIRGNKYELNFIVLLYTGCRPCELQSLSFEKEGFITFRNRKQHNGVIAFKDIPVTPMLAPYIERVKENLPLNDTTELAKIFSKLVPGQRMYSLRHTFATRCQTCGVPQHIVGRWLGHKSTVITDAVYTHFDPSFMLEEAKKVRY